KGMKSARKQRVAPQKKVSDEVRFEGRERDYVYAIAMKYLKDEDEAADVTQDALLNAFRHRASFRGDSRFTTWLYRVAGTTALMHLRKRGRARVALGSQEVHSEDGEPVDLAEELPAPGPSPEDEAAAHEALSLVGRRLSSLGEKYGPIFRMRFADGFSESE